MDPRSVGMPRRAVVLAHDLSARGGAERVAIVAATVLRDLGYDTRIATWGPMTDASALGRYYDTDLSGVSLVTLPSPRLGPLRFAEVRETAETIGWTHAVRRLHPSVLVNCMFRSTVHGVATERNLYYVHFPHDLDPVAARGPRRAYVRGLHVVQKVVAGRGHDWRDSYDHFLANSRFTAEHVESRWHRPARILHPPCRMIDPGHAARNNWILNVGRFQDRAPGRPHKRQDVLVETFASLTDLHTKGWELHLVGSVGSPRELDRLRTLAGGVPVRFHPDASYEELTTLYRRSSIYWHAQGFGESSVEAPVAQEHFGIATVEAMSAGLIPLVYGSAGPAEVVAPLGARATTWFEANELAAATRAVAGLTCAEQENRRREGICRAHDFDATHFRTQLVDVLEAHD